jgi:hypothetical protein
VVPQLEPWYCWKGTWQLVGDCGAKSGVDPNHPRQLPQSRAYMTSGLYVTSISPPLMPVTSTPLHFIYIHVVHLHASCLPIGRLPPRPLVHNQFITVKTGRKVNYSRDGVRLASESSDTDGELSLNHRSMQIGSRTIQQTTSSSSRDLLMQPVVSSGLQ